MFEKLKYKFKMTKEKFVSLIIVLKTEYLKEKKLENASKRKLNLMYIRKILTNPKRLFDVLRGKKLYVPYVEIVITTTCTLKCQGCSALMGYYSNPQHMDPKDIINALNNLLESVDSINFLHLLGGEPLTYPYLYEILEFAKSQEKIKYVAIVTNGTLTIKDDRIINILKDGKFFVSISDYGEISRNYNQLIRQLKENKIMYKPMSKNYKWIDYGGFDKRSRTDKEFKNQFFACTHKRVSMLNGKLFKCFRCSHATNLNLIELKEKDYINFNKNKAEKKDVYNFIYNYYDCTEACKYCDCIKDEKTLTRGAQIKNKNEVKI